MRFQGRATRGRRLTQSAFGVLPFTMNPIQLMSEVMDADSNLHHPPEDRLFQDLLHRAVNGEVEVYGVVIATEKVVFTRAFEHHHPENMEGGQELVQTMWSRWQMGNPVQPWLYVWNGEYVVADDYFWLALIEKGRPGSVAAQVLGNPLEVGLLQKLGPLPVERVRELLGVAIKPR